MKLTEELWKKLLQQQQTAKNKGKQLTRQDIRTHFDLSEHNARFLYDSLKSIDVLKSEPLSRKTNLTEKNKQLKKELRAHQKEILELNTRLGVYDELSGTTELKPPTWTTPETVGDSKVIATAVLSDLHFAENVDPEQVEGTNKYNIEIATQRLSVFFDKVCMLNKGIYEGMEVEGLVLCCLGDLLSGSIHDELEITNDMPVLEATVLLTELLCAGIDQLVACYGKVHTVCCVGNHGRMLKGRPKAKGAVSDNFEFILFKMIEKHFRNDNRVTFQIASSPDTTYTLYNTTFRVSHGNNMKGGGGISGPLLAIRRGDYKLKARSLSVDNPYDCLIIGHFHQYLTSPDIICNGSIVGMNEYAFNAQFPYQPPTQAFFLTDSEHGRVADFPIYCTHPAEDWHPDSAEVPFGD